MLARRVRLISFYLACLSVLVLAALAFSGAPARPLHASPLPPPERGSSDAPRPLSNPSLTWNTFLGGSGFDAVYSTAVDVNGNVYVAGYSEATWQGANPPVRDHSGGGDALVAKLNPSGTLLWHTFLGGSAYDTAYGIALDASGNISVAGFGYDTWQGTNSPIRPYTGDDGDAFVAKLNSSDGTLLWNTFLGGAAYDDANSIVTDQQGNVYLTGESDGTWQATKPPVRGYGGSADAMVAKLSPDGALLWNTFLGGTEGDFGSDIAVDSNGNVYVGGSSTAAWQGISTPVRNYTGGTDAYVAKLTPDGGLTWNTFLGDSGTDDGRAVAVDNDGNALVTGESNVTWGSPVRHFTGSANPDAFAAKLNSNGGLTWNTFLGSGGVDQGRGIAVDSGNIYVSGSSDATWGSPILPHSNLFDAYVSSLSLDGALAWNTFLGGSGDDYARKRAVVNLGYLYLPGYSNATWGSPVRDYTSGDDAFVAKIDILWRTGLPLIKK